MDKKELAARISQQTLHPAKTVEDILEQALEEIYMSLKQGESVTLRNFGTFYVRPGRSQWVFKFNPSQRLRQAFGWASTYKGDG